MHDACESQQQSTLSRQQRHFQSYSMPRSLSFQQEERVYVGVIYEGLRCSRAVEDEG